MKKIKLSLIAMLATGSLYAGTYNVDQSHSEVGFKVKHMMISNVKGNFKEFNGSFEYNEKENKLVSINGTIESKSINTENEKRDAHLKEGEFFDVAKYPKITFEATEIKNGKAIGELTLKGITKKVELEVETGGIVKDPWGKQRAGITLKGEIKRSDFGLTYNKVLETGGVAVSNEVKLEIEIEGILKEGITTEDKKYI